MSTDVLAALQQVNSASPFDVWANVVLESAGDGEAVLSVVARGELTQHAGFLHAGVQSALIDRACGFAAASVVGAVTTSQFQVAFYAPAMGDSFVARARVVRTGKRQIFVNADLFAVQAGTERLVAGGSAVLCPLA